MHAVWYGPTRHILIFEYKYDLFVHLLLLTFCIFYKNNHMLDKNKILWKYK